VYKGGAVYQQYKNAGILTKDDYLRGYDYKLKLLTSLRLKLLSVEEAISRVLRRGLSRISKRPRAQELLPE
jgi:hypothetical protein